MYFFKVQQLCLLLPLSSSSLLCNPTPSHNDEWYEYKGRDRRTDGKRSFRPNLCS